MVAVHIAARQIDAGHDVKLIFEDLGGQLIQLPPQLTHHRLVRVPGRTLQSRLFDSDFSRIAKPEIESADILHVHGIWRRIPFGSMKFAGAAGIPFLISPHGMLNGWALRQNPMRKKAAFALGTWNLIQQAKGMHALSQYELNCLQQHQLNAVLTRIPNGVDLTELDPLPAKGTFRKKYPRLIRDGCHLPFVLFLARLHPGKRLDLLIESFALVSLKIPELRLVIVGPDAGARADTEARIRRYRLEDKVILTGAIWGREKFEALVDATCYCLPSEHESFSVAIVEALACGCPVIISDACHFPEVQESEAGIETQLDIQQLAKAMHELVINTEQRKMMSANARQLVEAKYQWHVIAAQLTDFYQHLCGSSSCGRQRGRHQRTA